MQKTKAMPPLPHPERESEKNALFPHPYPLLPRRRGSPRLRTLLRYAPVPLLLLSKINSLVENPRVHRALPFKVLGTVPLHSHTRLPAVLRLSRGAKPLRPHRVAHAGPADLHPPLRAHGERANEHR